MWSNLLELLLSPTGATFIAGILLFIYKTIFKVHVPVVADLLQKYHGSVASIIKRVEKEIPDNTENKSIRRLDLALKYLTEVYSAGEGKQPNEAMIVVLKELINRVHVELEHSELL